MEAVEGQGVVKETGCREEGGRVERGVGSKGERQGREGLTKVR